MDNEKKVYDLLQKKTILKEIMTGMTVTEAANKYSISDTTLRSWLQKYNDQMKKEIQDEMNVMRNENAVLKTLLGESALKIRMLEEEINKTRYIKKEKMEAE